MEKLAVSLSGHDRGTLYVILSEREDRVFLADGHTRTFAHPKLKNPRHVQAVCYLSENVADALRQAATDADLVYVLRLYRSEQKRNKNSGRN
mgnify:CR=1 FL=1